MTGNDDLDFWLVVEKFYETLFEKAPEIAAMLGNKSNRETMMMIALKSIGDEARRDGQLVDYMKMLGEKHRGYGLTEQHMKIGRRAFEQAIEAGGKNLSKERKRHYLDAFVGLENAMGFDLGSKNVD
jgi:hemoglobin-like flavoprotein